MPEGGHWKPDRVVIIEFPDMDALNACYNAPEYPEDERQIGPPELP
jgi:uncharacterized protein (DUF1330 family)